MKNAMTFLLCGSLLGAIACSPPDVDSTQWECETNLDCGSGWVCGNDSFCERAYVNLHGITDKKITMGMTSDFLSDGGGPLSVDLRDGALAYFEYHNQTKGGVHGRKLELITMDDGYDGSTAAENATTMLSGENRSAFGLMLNLGTDTNKAIVPVVNEYKALLWAPYTGAGGVFRSPTPEKYVFNYRASYSQEAGALVSYFHRRAKRVVPRDIIVFAQADPVSQELDAFGQAGFDGVLAAAQDIDPTVTEADIAQVSYLANPQDVAQSIYTLAVSTRDVLLWMMDDKRTQNEDGLYYTASVMAGAPAASQAFVPIMRGIQQQIISFEDGGSDNETITVITGVTLEVTPAQVTRLKKTMITMSAISPADASALQTALLTTDPSGAICEGVIISNVVPYFQSGNATVSEYREHLASAFGSEKSAGYASLEGYLAAKLLVEAFERHGPDITTDSFVATLEEMKDIDFGLGKLLGFSRSDHQASNQVWGVQFDNECTMVDLPDISD